MGARADEKSAEQEGARVRQKYFDSQVGETIAGMAEKRRLLGTEARRRHASGMFQSYIAKKDGPEDFISLLDFVSMYFPHLPRSAVKKACEKYAPLRPPVVKKAKTLKDVEGAKDEIKDMFAGLDSDKDGLVRMRSLEPKILDLGISKADIEEWMQELPPVLCRKQAGGLQDEVAISRMKSKLTLQDMECLLAPVHLVSPKKRGSLKEIKEQIRFCTEVARDAIYG